MEFLLAKQDLDTFSNSNINLLVLYFDIPVQNINSNDILWELAIAIQSTANSVSNQHAEMPPSGIWTKYREELITRFKTDKSAPKGSLNELPIEFVNADPTGNNKFLEWIVKSYIDGGIRLFEDLSRMNIALTEYTFLLNKKLLKAPEIDIRAFCGLSGCKQKGKKGRKIDGRGLDTLLDEYEK